jgi:hypothetical protein
MDNMGDTIVYSKEGEKCGIENNYIGLVSLGTYTHYVCNQGLACYTITDFQGIDVQRCVGIKKKIAEDCIPEYNHCFRSYTCKRNQYDEYTCDGQAMWKGNIGMDSNSIHRVSFEQNTNIIILGMVIVTLWFIGLLLFVGNKIKNSSDEKFDPMIHAAEHGKVLFYDEYVGK